MVVYSIKSSLVENRPARQMIFSSNFIWYIGLDKKFFDIGTEESSLDSPSSGSNLKIVNYDEWRPFLPLQLVNIYLYLKESFLYHLACNQTTAWQSNRTLICLVGCWLRPSIPRGKWASPSNNVQEGAKSSFNSIFILTWMSFLCLKIGC